MTLPASFDEVARELTVEAAARAGLPRVVLIEEPQAAFYAWIYKHQRPAGRHWSGRARQSWCVTLAAALRDFTLIRVRAAQPSPARPSPARPSQGSRDTAGEQGEQEADERIQFHRIAVGNHLILGGDNLDLALARHLEQKLTGGGKLPSNQWDVLVAVCQRVKEADARRGRPGSADRQLAGAGAKLIGGGERVDVERQEAQELLVDGFLPLVGLGETPRKRQSGFQEFGLPYAADPAISRYLAAFLTAHCRRRFRGARQPAAEDDVDDRPTRPDILLLNGGFFSSPLLRRRIISLISQWYQHGPDRDGSPIVLDNDRLDLAVARGAAYYAMVRRGEGVRIAANLSHSYYIGVESAEPTAVCLVPGSAEPGQDLVLADQTFQLLISQPVEFPLWASSTRLTDRPGDLVPIDREQMSPLPPIRTVLRARSRRETGTIPVHLHARPTDIGTIELWCSAADRDRTAGACNSISAPPPRPIGRPGNRSRSVRGCWTSGPGTSATRCWLTCFPSTGVLGRKACSSGWPRSWAVPGTSGPRPCCGACGKR